MNTNVLHDTETRFVLDVSTRGETVIEQENVRFYNLRMKKGITVKLNLQIQLDHTIDSELMLCNENGSRVMDFYPKNPSGFNNLFEEFLFSCRNKQIPLDLSFVHQMIQNRSTEEIERNGYIFEADHAREFFFMYREWVLGTIAKNITFSVIIQRPEIENDPPVVKLSAKFPFADLKTLQYVFTISDEDDKAELDNLYKQYIE